MWIILILNQFIQGLFWFYQDENQNPIILTKLKIYINNEVFHFIIIIFKFLYKKDFVNSLISTNDRN